MSDNPKAANYSPLGERECWPVTGPIYGLIAAGQPARPAKSGVWARWLLKERDNSEQIMSGPVSPVRY